MANTVTKTTLIDGPRHVVVHVYLASDGLAGELTDEVLIDVSALTPSANDLTLECVWYSLNGFSGVLEWDATTDVPFLVLQDSDCCFMDFRGIGGIPNNAGAGKTGDLTLTTTGFTAAGDAGTITLKCKKN
ncbi:MAG: hypothetical protein D6698_02320 [Gammaproteobacteria bacterium]|nr:MAG: hypothetical protein D6698_02320 [Gammaproteobacteria bacterium]